MESTEGRKDLVFITKVYEVNMMSWFSKEDLAFIMKVYEAFSSTKFEVPTKTKTRNFAWFLINQYVNAGFNVESQEAFDFIRFELTRLLRATKSSSVIYKMLNKSN